MAKIDDFNGNFRDISLSLTWHVSANSYISLKAESRCRKANQQAAVGLCGSVDQGHGAANPAYLAINSLQITAFRRKTEIGTTD
ncbi:MAG: hypothetical protein ACREBX_13130 [Sphingopyxis sp.]